MNYSIELSRKAVKALQSIPKSEQKKIQSKIDKLRKNPLPVGNQKLAGMENLFRIRSGDYRIIYQIKKNKLLILVLNIGHRKEIYR